MTGSDDAICGGCWYDLSGLGRQGQCPECGQRFDTMTGAGLDRRAKGEPASERHRRGERMVRRLGMVFMFGIAVLVLICGGMLTLLVDDWRYPVVTTALIAVIFALSGASWYLGDGDDFSNSSGS